MSPKMISCNECNINLGKKYTLFNKYLCDTCKVTNKYTVITKTNAKKQYLFKDEDLIELPNYTAKSSYCIATYYTIEDLNNKASIKYNIHKENISEYLSQLLYDKKLKSEERKQKIIKKSENINL
jgi:hypothetical protein